MIRRLRWAIRLSVALVLFVGQATASQAEDKTGRVVLAIHGGFAVHHGSVTNQLESQMRASLEESLRAGRAALDKPNGTSLDAVEAAIRVLEDSSLFNAGKGAVFTREGRNELDASLIDGRTKKAGAVACVTTIRNPIAAARAVMEKSNRVLLVGRGAEEFAARNGVETVNPVYFWSEPRWKELLEYLKKADRPDTLSRSAGNQAPLSDELGTVGAVALDRSGNLAAGASTGGLNGKQPGRVGDSPIIGAGTYADNDACAVSSSGQGEFFIRYAVAFDIVSLMKYKGFNVETAANEVIQNKLKRAGGSGGVIVLDAKGNLFVTANDKGFCTATITDAGAITVSFGK